MSASGEVPIGGAIDGDSQIRNACHIALAAPAAARSHDLFIAAPLHQYPQHHLWHLHQLITGVASTTPPALRAGTSIRGEAPRRTFGPTTPPANING